MRSLVLSVIALALFASPASAAVIEFEDHFCGCDLSSGDKDTRGIIVRAAPGEVNRMSVRLSPRGVVIEDPGAPLTGACHPASSGGRFCRGQFDDGVDVQLGDGDDQIDLRDLGGLVDGGPGDDQIVVAGPPYRLTGGPGADRLDATSAPGSSVSYRDHTDGVTVRLNGLQDDGAPGEGDDLRGAITGIAGGSGDDVLEAGPTAGGLSGEGGDDMLVGSPERDSLNGGDGDDELAAGDGNDYLVGAAGADVLSGGPGHDEVSYGGPEALRLSIGDGANDGAAGEGDDIREDVEDLTGGDGADVLIGDADANRLAAYGGHDVLVGGDGADYLQGWGDGDRLDPGPGRDRVQAGASDLPLLDDGEADRTDCDSSAPLIEADSLDTFRRCAPRVFLDRVSGPDSGGVVRVSVRCDLRSAVRCAGTLQLRMLDVARSRAVRFGPIRPRRRKVVTLRMRGGPIPHNTCLQGRAVTTRRDVPSSTVSNDLLRCRL